MSIQIFLCAGIGNRLFQYASIKGLAHKYNLNFSIYGIDINTDHQENDYNWLLNIFKSENCIKMSRYDLYRRSDIKTWFQPIPEHIGYYEPHLEYLKDSVIFGYFQSEKYFKSIEKELKEELKEPEFITPILNKYITDTLHENPNEILDNYCAIHIRVGDFLKNQRHFVNLQVYYMKCIDKIRTNVENPIFLIICENPDDMNKAYPYLIPYIKRYGYETFIVPSKINKTNELTDKLDNTNNNTLNISITANNSSFIDIECFHLYLMTRVKTVICANSTFSWWGSWLNSHPDKKIYIPSRWINDPEIYGESPRVDMEGAEIIQI